MVDGSGVGGGGGLEVSANDTIMFYILLNDGFFLYYDIRAWYS